jgi:hypothetical protein
MAATRTATPPPSPASIDSIPLTSDQRKRLSLLISLVWRANRTRRPEAVVQQAVTAFLRTVKRHGQAYADLPYFHLGPDGTGPVVRAAPAP